MFASTDGIVDATDVGPGALPSPERRPIPW